MQYKIYLHCYSGLNISFLINPTISTLHLESTAVTRPWVKITLHWRHNDHDGVSNHQPRGCLLNRLFRRRSKKTSKLRFTGLCVGNSPGPVNSPHKGPVTRKMCPFNDVIMCLVPGCYYLAPYTWCIYYKENTPKQKYHGDNRICKMVMFYAFRVQSYMGLIGELRIHIGQEHLYY